MIQTDVIQMVRAAIYRQVAATGRFLTVGEVAALYKLDRQCVEDAFRALADGHVIVLKPGTLEICWAPPFSAMPTSFHVRCAGVSFYAPCAWDALGIPAAMKADAAIDARCAWSGEPLPISVSNGVVLGEGLIHLEVPARRFWDDIFYT